MSYLGTIPAHFDDARREMAEHEIRWDRQEAMERFIPHDHTAVTPTTTLPRPPDLSFDEFAKACRQARAEGYELFRERIGLPPSTRHH